MTFKKFIYSIFNVGPTFPKAHEVPKVPEPVSPSNPESEPVKPEAKV